MNIGTIRFTKHADANGVYLLTAHGSLTDAILSSVTSKNYTMSGNETVGNTTTDNPLTLGGTSLEIEASGFTISGKVNGKGIILANNTQSLTINNGVMNAFTTALDNTQGARIALNNVTIHNSTEPGVINNGEGEEGFFKHRCDCQEWNVFL